MRPLLAYLRPAINVQNSGYSCGGKCAIVQHGVGNVGRPVCYAGILGAMVVNWIPALTPSCFAPLTLMVAS